MRLLDGPNVNTSTPTRNARSTAAQDRENSKPWRTPSKTGDGACGSIADGIAELQGWLREAEKSARQALTEAQTARK